jgi:hypothetical protein
LFTPVSRTLARAVSAVAVLLCVGGLTAVPALAQPDSSTTSPEAPPTGTTETPPTSEPPAPPDPAKPAAGAAPDLKLTASVEPGTYVIGQDIPINVTVTNAGEGVATKVLGNTYEVDGSGISSSADGWREFTDFQPGNPLPASGGTIQPGAAEKFVLLAKASKPGEVNPRLWIVVDTSDELTRGDNGIVLTVPVLPPSVKGAIGGVVYGDANDNNVSDPGEGVQGVEITLNLNDGDTRSARTDHGGRFDFQDLPAMRYTLSVPSEEVEGWIIGDAGSVLVDGTDKSHNVTVRAERPLSTVLNVAAKFGAKTYKTGDVATASITLTNRGTKRLSGIKAECERYEADALLGGIGDREHFGELAYDGSGATLAAGETRVFEVRGDVLPGAQNEGLIYLACSFGADDRYIAGFPKVFEYAKVPGRAGDLGGVVYQDFNGNDAVDDGEAIPNVRFGLSEWGKDAVVVKTTTDSHGVAQFIRLPRGWYAPVVYGPWKLVNPAERLINPLRQIDYFTIKVVPGPDNPESAGTPSATPDPVPAAGDGGSASASDSDSRSGLASTGVEVFGPVAGGTAAVLTGILALLYARRLRRHRADT